MNLSDSKKKYSGIELLMNVNKNENISSSKVYFKLR